MSGQGSEGAGTVVVSVVDQTFVLKELQTICYEPNGELCASIIHFKQAYDSVDGELIRLTRATLKHTMNKVVATKKLLKLLKQELKVKTRCHPFVALHEVIGDGDVKRRGLIANNQTDDISILHRQIIQSCWQKT